MIKGRKQILSLFCVSTLSFCYLANMIYLLATKRGRQILSLFCVITLIWLILLYSSIADVVAIMHQNAPFVDFCKSSIADFVEILRDHASLL
jgi:hypothetical protein